MSAKHISNLRILVVDDEPLVCEAIKLMLDIDGHTVEAANGSEEALTIFKSGKFDLVFTDYTMPGMKGDELAVAIKAAAPLQPVIMITAHAEILRSMPGVDFLVSKPFYLEQLREAIVKVLPGKLNAA